MTDKATTTLTMREQMARALFKSDNDASIAIAEDLGESSAMLDYLRSRTWENCAEGFRQRCYRRVDVILDLLTKPPTEAQILDGLAMLRGEPGKPNTGRYRHYDPVGFYRAMVTSIWETMVRAMINEGKQP